MFNKLLTVGTILAMLVILFPEGKAGYDTFIGIILGMTGITGGFTYLIFTTLPYWVIGAVIFRVVWTLIKRDSPGNVRF